MKIKNAIILLIIFCAAFPSLYDYFTSKDEIITKRERTLVTTNDTLWFCDMTHPFCRKLKIDNDFTIIFNGDVCKIGTFDDEIINDTLRKVFNSCVAFEAKSNYSDLSNFITELEKGKKALIRCSKICKENSIKHHIESFVTGNPPTFSLGSTYCKEGESEYIEVHGITTGNEEHISNYQTFRKCQKYFDIIKGEDGINNKYVSFNVSAKLKFDSVSQLDVWISKLKQFRNNKFVKFDDCFKS